MAQSTTARPGEARHQCSECESAFPDPEALLWHLERVHPEAVCARDEAAAACEPTMTDDERVDAQSEDSFPASDPPSYTPVQGSGAPPHAAERD